MSPLTRADVAVSCLEVWRDNEIEMPRDSAQCIAMVLDDLATIGMAERATEIDVADIADRIMTTLGEQAEQAYDTGSWRDAPYFYGHAGWSR